MIEVCSDCLQNIRREPGCFVCDCGPSFALEMLGFSNVVGRLVLLARPQLPEPQPQAEAPCR